MQKIPLKMATHGMILGEAVQREDGLVLVGAGAELTESIINRLTAAGIGSITVKGRPVAGGAGGDYKSLIENLEPMFRNYRENRFMLGLQGVLRKYFKVKLAESEAAKQAAAEAEEQEAEEQQKEA